MRKFFALATLILLMIAGLNIGGLYLLTEWPPFGPGDLFFVIQHFGERQRAGLMGDPTERALFELDIAERRLADLIDRTGTPDEVVALEYLDLALDRATESVSNSPKLAESVLQRRLLALVNDINGALANLTVATEVNPGLVSKMISKVSLLLAFFEGEAPEGVTAQQLADGFDLKELVELSGVFPEPADPIAAGIPFQPGTGGAEHAFFPLIGGHQSLDCGACHTKDQFAGTPTQCAACHLEDAPANHFGNNCSSCHTPVSWQAATFDHSMVPAANCNQCHSSDKPANHYSGQCSACHNPSGWGNVSFNHAGQTDCKACHSSDAPASHYSGQCSACHNPSGWGNVSINHAGQTNCVGCHTSDAPANHYAGQCSACHNPNGWGSVSFNHAGQTDCVGCHSGDASANHYTGQCSACHNTNGWADANFSHTGQTDCVGCHSSNAPNNHFPGQCSACHNPNGWGDANFSHAGQTDCVGCHSGDAPNNHFPGQCSACHNPSDWDDADFNHTGQTDCLSCHSGDEPDDEDHPQGQQCSDCHTTQNWDTDDKPAPNLQHPVFGQRIDLATSLFAEAVSNLRFNAKPEFSGANLADCGLCHNPDRLEG